MEQRDDKEMDPAVGSCQGPSKTSNDYSIKVF